MELYWKYVHMPSERMRLTSELAPALSVSPSEPMEVKTFSMEGGLN